MDVGRPGRRPVISRLWDEEQAIDLSEPQLSHLQNGNGDVPLRFS